MCVSKRFRQQLFHVLVRLYRHCRKQPVVDNNAVSPDIEMN